jgi:hypothetical protein
MSRPQLISHFEECRDRLATVRDRADFLPLHAAILRVEGACGDSFFDSGRSFAFVLSDRAYWYTSSISNDESYSIAFHYDSQHEALRQKDVVQDSTTAPSAADPSAIAVLRSVEQITDEVRRLITELPASIREGQLALPDFVRPRSANPYCTNWWRTVFHLAWHFRRPFLTANRERVFKGPFGGRKTETFVQINGTGGLEDLLPGLIYSNLEHDICTSSQAAISVVIEALRSSPDAPISAGPMRMILTAEQRSRFRQLRQAFEEGISRGRMGMDTTMKLIRVADSFATPPAIQWGDPWMGGCAAESTTLSRLNADQEICEVRGPATNWFWQLAEEPGSALPDNAPNTPIMFDRVHVTESGYRARMGSVHPVMNRGPRERWLGFVFAVLKQLEHEALVFEWKTEDWPWGYGVATLKLDPFASSALAISLMGFDMDQNTSLEDLRSYIIECLNHLDSVQPPDEALRAIQVGKCFAYAIEFGLASRDENPNHLLTIEGARQRLSELRLRVESAIEARETEMDFNGWKVLRDATEDETKAFPPPASGRFVIALDPPAIDGIAEMQGIRRHVPRREHMVLMWENNQQKRVLYSTDGHLLSAGKGDATWLPDGWTMDTYPAGWTLSHIQAWFKCAFGFASITERPDLEAGSEKSPSYAPTPRGLVSHAFLIVRHLKMKGGPKEPTGPMDVHGCLAALREVQEFIESSMRVSGKASAGENGAVRVKEVILLVHGIRTFASWQPMVKRVLEEIPNTHVIPIKYGYFDAISFWFPLFSRQWPINDIRRQIQNAKAEHPDAKISLIVHSFGSYAISKILLDNPDIKLHRLILSGSIVPRSFRWDYVGSRLETVVINDYGTRDVWPVLATCLSWGYGDTGRHGFGRGAKVKDRGHDYSHSEFFNEDFVRKYWKPWFENGKFVESSWAEKAPPASRWLGVLSVLPLQWIILALILITVLLAIRY